jgi:chemotaxis regulatin CheY-phosphate phosphatase CheZ
VTRKGSTKLTSIEVTEEHIPAPDARQRLARVYEIILKAAARVEEKVESNAPDDREADHDAH